MKKLISKISLVAVFCLFITSSFGAQCPPGISEAGEAACLDADENAMTITQSSSFAYGGGCTDACGDCQVLTTICHGELMTFIYWG